MPRKYKKTKMEEARKYIDHWDKEGRSITQELGRLKAEGLRDSYNSYIKAGFTPEDAMRLLLQDALLAASH